MWRTLPRLLLDKWSFSGSDLSNCPAMMQVKPLRLTRRMAAVYQNPSSAALVPGWGMEPRKVHVEALAVARVKAEAR